MPRVLPPAEARIQVGRMTLATSAPEPGGSPSAAERCTATGLGVRFGDPEPTESTMEVTTATAKTRTMAAVLDGLIGAE